MNLNLIEPPLLLIFCSEKTSNPLFISPGYGFNIEEITPLITKCFLKTIHNPIRLVKYF